MQTEKQNWGRPRNARLYFQQFASYPHVSNLHWHIRCTISLASFPGFHIPECKHWSCAGVESLVFFLMWALSKEERDFNCVWAYPRLRTGKKRECSKLNDYKYLAIGRRISYTPSVECSVDRTMHKTLPFCFSPILTTSCSCRKKYQALRVIPIHIPGEPGNEATISHNGNPRSRNPQSDPQPDVLMTSYIHY